jgi:hypothetical protein
MFRAAMLAYSGLSTHHSMLTLPLLMAWIGAKNPHDAAPAHDFAFGANRLYR